MSILEELGLNPDELKWQDLAACKNVVQVVIKDADDSIVDVETPGKVRELQPGERREVFDPLFDAYEEDIPPHVIRQATDEMCMSCPVQRQCYEFGKSNGETGVFGGVYLTAGRPDRTRNEHKTTDTWDAIREAVGKL